MASKVTTISGLQNLINLQEFRGDYNAFQSVNFSGLENLTLIDVSDCDFSGTNTPSLTSVNLSGCTALQELRLDDSDFSGGIPSLSEFSNLEYIDFDQCLISGSVNISALTSLKGADFSGNEGLTELIISSSQPIGQDGYSLYAYNCALTQESIDDILVALSTNGVTNAYVDLSGGTNAAPGVTGLAAKTVLEENGWSISVN
jgi:uncharacterized protein YjbI with pentapeptide repeats